MSDTPLGRGAKVFLNMPIFLQTMEDYINSKFLKFLARFHIPFSCVMLMRTLKTASTML